MENLAHIALWRYADGRVGAAILAPSRLEFLDEVRKMVVTEAVYNRELGIALFSPAAISVAGILVTQHYGAHVCPICLRLETPCWHWRSRRIDSPVGELAHEPMPVPNNPTAEMARFLSVGNALSQLAAGSVNLQTALQTNIARAATPSRRTRTRQPTAAPAQDPSYIALLSSPSPEQPEVQPVTTPAGTIRCSTCGQVIPPGFERVTDKKKTEDEVYAECAHDFDLTTRVCKRCNLKERTACSRFSLLEVD